MTEYDPDRILADLARWQEAADEMDRIAAELPERRYTGRSRSGYVSAEVDGNGTLLDITVSEEALRQSHPESIGPDTVEAITNARNAVGAESVASMQKILGVSIG